MSTPDDLGGMYDPPPGAVPLPKGGWATYVPNIPPSEEADRDLLAQADRVLEAYRIGEIDDDDPELLRVLRMVAARRKQEEERNEGES